MAFAEHQPLEAMLGTEAGNFVFAVLPNAPNQVARNTDEQRSIGLVGTHVDPARLQSPSGSAVVLFTRSMLNRLLTFFSGAAAIRRL